MKVISTQCMRDLDRRTIEEFGTPGYTLMDRAGYGIARYAQTWLMHTGLVDPTIHLVAGRGNNGGDIFVAARYLCEAGVHVIVWLAGDQAQLKGDALDHFKGMKDAGVDWMEMPSAEQWTDALHYPLQADMLIEGLLGTGISGAARSPIAEAITYINAVRHRTFVISVDIPSGLNSDDGEVAGVTVKADVTLTMAFPKKGIVVPESREYTGSLYVIDIGIPEKYREEVEEAVSLQCITAHDVYRFFSKRKRSSHKGSYGHALLIGGACGYSGAISMAAGAAARIGTGLITVMVPESIQDIVAGCMPEIMVKGCPETEMGSLSSMMIDSVGDMNERYTAVLIGPGLTQHEESRKIVEYVLRHFSGPVVIDADALNVIGTDHQCLKDAAGKIVLTPHPGEMSRLVDMTVPDIQNDRMSAVASAVDMTQCTVILKGDATLVGTADSDIYTNLTGNPGMATGGSGDVLAGIIAGLCAQGLDVDSAVCAGVYLHGVAGDIAAWALGQESMLAGDIIDSLPGAFRLMRQMGG